MPIHEYHEIARTADRTRLAVQVRGTGPALLLLPGQANNHHWWDYVRPDFDREYTTITFDYRGTGGSGSPDGTYSTQLFADDALAVMDSLSIEQFDVYGASMGGRTAQWVAIRAPQRVRRLVLGCTTPGGSHAVERSSEIRKALAGPQSTRTIIDLMYTPEWQSTHPGPYQVLGDPKISDRARRQHLIASNSHDAWAELPTISAPTLILHGSDDQFAPAVNAEIIADAVPDSRTHIFGGARHAYFDECREAASPLVLEFLKS
ncbi:alpha/beta fold hydrolase [Gordonia sp. CPCC 205515]|uniref:alpha/beta fold hydrolase n=1 Tax=Gordonia sp. CPCC 205515 TaxID=3140791 RepID=UPI003AF332C7